MKPCRALVASLAALPPNHSISGGNDCESGPPCPRPGSPRPGKEPPRPLPHWEGSRPALWPDLVAGGGLPGPRRRKSRLRVIYCGFNYYRSRKREMLGMGQSRRFCAIRGESACTSTSARSQTLRCFALRHQGTSARIVTPGPMTSWRACSPMSPIVSKRSSDYDAVVQRTKCHIVFFLF
jgi:hypothetical protein